MHNTINVGIIGAGLSGLAVANGLLDDKEKRYNVQIFERDTVAFEQERGGYQIRIAAEGLKALKTISDDETWKAIVPGWKGDEATAPVVVSPDDFHICLSLPDLKIYPQSKPIPRQGLRKALLARPMREGRVHFGHQLESYDLTRAGVSLTFVDRPNREVDILIAADGSNSVINRQAGLNNKLKLNQWSLIQAQAVIDQTTKSKLPQALLRAGSCTFLGGRRLSGFSSVYRVGEDEQGRDQYALFWACLVPAEHGGRMIEKSKGERDTLVPLLTSYLRDNLRLGPSLPLIIESATDRLRTGALTSSFQPTSDWRAGSLEMSRIILLGDAVHPMTPGRGMGANQALTDAGELVTLLRNARYANDVPSDKELAILTSEFEQVMYPRAFKMVRASEDIVGLDLTKFTTRWFVTVLEIGLTIVGWVVSALEMVGFRQREELDFLRRDS